MSEIIELFQAERDEQLREMAESLAVPDFEKLSRLAHTIKGSLAALHAPAARQTCQTIELAAKDRDAVLCAGHLDRLEQDLADLTKALDDFRATRLRY
jgi:HPt (histidine-containing phosphotransfer) domain-containing protein